MFPRTPPPPTALRPDQRAFQAEVRALLRSDKVQDEVRRIRRLPPGREPALLDTYRWLGERGWLAPSWPERYGGLGATAVETAIVTEELALAGVPDDAHVLSVDIVGMFLLNVGTPEQRDGILPGLARGERLATVLFTEPHAGSDLSRLTTRAEPDGDGFRLSGTKVFNQKSQFAEVALCAARTRSGGLPFAGITLFLLPLRSPGVLIRPVPNLTNDQFLEITIDGVHLSHQDVVGEVDDGWRLLNELLVLERTGIDFHAKIRRWLAETVAPALTDGTLDDPVLAARWAELDARLTAGQALAWRMVTELAAGRADPVLAAMAKWYAAEQAEQVVRFCRELTGAAGLLSVWDDAQPELGPVEVATRYAPTLTLASGTAEVMLYVIATSGLGLL